MAHTGELLCYFNNALVPMSEAKLTNLTHGFNYGTGCFEGIRGYWNAAEGQLYLFRLREHYKRFLVSTKILRMNFPYTVDDYCRLTLEMLQRNNFQENIYIRPTAYKCTETIGVRLHDLEDALTIVAIPFGDYVEMSRPLRTQVSSWRRIDDNMIPARAKISGAYVNSALAKSEALENGFDEAIMLTAEGNVSEGSAENIFLMLDGRLVTPSVTENILEGITRDAVMQLASQELGLTVVERPIDRTELYKADEIFFTGTGVQLAAVGEVDHRHVGDGKMGPITAQLSKLFFAVVQGENKKYAHWNTPVIPQTVQRQTVYGGE